MMQKKMSPKFNIPDVSALSQETSVNALCLVLFSESKENDKSLFLNEEQRQAWRVKNTTKPICDGKDPGC